MIWWILAVVVLLLWLGLNCFSQFAILKRAKAMSIGRIPADILKRANAHHVQYFTDDLLPRGCAYTLYLGKRHAVVLDNTFLKRAQPAQVRFVLAHELGHAALGHIRLRWLCVVSGAVLLPWVRNKLKDLETQADKYAEDLSGYPREVLTQTQLHELYDLVGKAQAPAAPAAPFKKKDTPL